MDEQSKSFSLVLHNDQSVEQADVDIEKLVEASRAADFESTMGTVVKDFSQYAVEEVGRLAGNQAADYASSTGTAVKDYQDPLGGSEQAKI